MRLIDADRLLLEKMQGKYYHLPNGDIAIPIIDIKNAPTVEQPEIIHCKDCTYWDEFPSSTINIEYHKCSGFPIFTESKRDDFCSRGERKE